MDRDSSPDMGDPPRVIHGWISYINRKTGEVRQRLPFDVEKLSIGRDEQCDIRLLYEDVSRVHAEIHYDLLEGDATLVVCGSSGLHYIASGQTKIKLPQPTRQILQSGDQFIIRKQTFQFDYAEVNTIYTTPMSPSVTGTPVKSAVTAPAQSKRRASHRLSLLPADKPFVPLSPMRRRASQLGPAGNTPRKSLASMAVPEMDDEADAEQEELMEGIVDVQQNENGDMMVLEVRQEKESPPVRTQQTPGPPKTPRSVPLPAPAETPYMQTPPRVSSKVAMSTPPGPMTLHKALLLRSARKAWHQTRSNDIVDAVEDGNIELKRKSRSPSKDKEEGGKRKSLTPKTSAEDDEDQPADDNNQHLMERVVSESIAMLQSKDDPEIAEGDSAEDSLEADISLDVVDEDGEGEADVDGDSDVDEQAIMYGDEGEHITIDEATDNRQAVHEVDVGELDDRFAEEPATFTPVAHRIADRFYTPQVARHTSQPRRSLASIGGPAVRASAYPASPNPLAGGAYRPTPARKAMPTPAPVKAEVGDENDEKPEIATPVKSISDREIAEIKKRRQSLATPRQLPSAPMSFRDPVKSAFSLVKSPSHPALTRPRSPGEDGEAEADNTPLSDIRYRLNKMKRDSSARELASNRRATVGFVLPATPARPAVQTSASYTAAPSSRFGHSAYVPPTPQTPVVGPAEIDSKVSSLQQTPVRTPAAKRSAGTPFSLMHHTPIQESPEPITPTANEAALPAKGPTSTSSPTMLKSKFGRTAVETPNHDASKSLLGAPSATETTLYPAIPAPISPALNGIRNLYPTIPLPPKTPDMRGLKGMFRPGVVQPTPGMDGLSEMFASPVKSEAAAGDVSTEIEEELEERSPRRFRQSDKPATMTPAAATGSSKRSRGVGIKTGRRVHEAVEVQDEDEEEVEEVERPSSSPAKHVGRATEPAATLDRSVNARNTATTATTQQVAGGRATKKSVPVTDANEEPGDKASAPSRRRTAAVTAGTTVVPDAAEPKLKPSRRTASATAPSAPAVSEPAVPASKASRSRSTAASSRVAKAIDVSAPTSPEAPSRPSRSNASAGSGAVRSKKAALGENNDQPQVILGARLEDSPVKTPAVEAGATAPVPSKSVSARAPRATKAVKSVAAETDSKSAPTRSAPSRSRGAAAAAKVDQGEKENVAEAKSAPSRGSRSTRAVKKEAVAADVEAPVTRATRSRK